MIPLAIIYSNEKQFLSEFGQHAEYPQVAVGDKHIGSLKETLQYLTYNKYI